MVDPGLVALLQERRLPPTVCPPSDVALRAVDTPRCAPFARDAREGLVATVSRDDPPYFGGYVDANFAALRDSLTMGDAEIKTLALNSFDAAFVSDQERTRWKAEVEAHFRATG